MMQTGPRLVGHPFTTLERELKRLVLREQLQQDQHQIVHQDGLSEREVKDKILKLYELYETFKNVDSSCLSDTETKFNLYQVYQNVFKTKLAFPPHSSIYSAAETWKKKPQRTVHTRAPPIRQNARHNLLGTSTAPPQEITALSFPRSSDKRCTTARVSKEKPRQSSTWRPQSAPANFEYNKLYTANRCHTSRDSCRPCHSQCACVICSPLAMQNTSGWRDITCALSPDRTQAEAHWETMSPLIMELQSERIVPVKKKKVTKKMLKEEDDDLKSHGKRKKLVKTKRSKESYKSVHSKLVEKTPKKESQLAWAAKPQKPKKVKKPEPNFPSGSPQRQKQHRQKQLYQRRRGTEKRSYRWDKQSSDSDSDDVVENSDLYIGLDKTPSEEDILFQGRLLRERKRHKWGDYSATLTARALYLYDREYDKFPRETLPLWGTKLSINADKTDLQFSFILKTASANKHRALFKMSALTEGEMRMWLKKLKEAMKLNIDITAEIARNKKPSVFGEMPENAAWSHEGYRIDVTYISDNILVCSFPPTRSDVYELKRFLDDKHRDNYKIVNVCEGQSYDASMFNDTLVNYPIPQNGVNQLSEIWSFCELTEQWLRESQQHVILIHCKSGCIQSGFMVAAHLIHVRTCWTSEQAIKLFSSKRDNAVISLPCHKRYLKYIEQSMVSGEQSEDISLLLSSISMSAAPAFNEDGSCKPYFVVYQGGVEVYEFESEVSFKAEEPVNFPMSLQIAGDIKILFYSVSDILGTQEMFTVHFHTFYISSSHVRFSRDMVDGAHLNTFKQFSDAFSVTLQVK